MEEGRNGNGRTGIYYFVVSVISSLQWMPYALDVLCCVMVESGNTDERNVPKQTKSFSAPGNL